MSSLDIFDYKKELRSLTYKVDVFEALQDSILSYYLRPVSTLNELKKRDLKTSIGTTWELFCKDWLLTYRKKEKQIYDRVWTLSEWNEYCKVDEIPASLHLRKQDIGIDLVARSDAGYHAIQCKWRKKGKVSWTDLSTFVALVSRGSWKSHIIMTNATGITWKVSRTDKDKSLCKTTFAHTPRTQWLEMIGEDPRGHKLTDEDRVEEASSSIEPISHEVVRMARLAHFCNILRPIIDESLNELSEPESLPSVEEQ
jgi:hypothetical protein